jgi:hypothetical protein
MKAQRKKLIIATVAVLAVVASITFAARPIRDAVCFALLSPPEKKLVGEWKSGTVVNTLRPDHTFTSVGGCLPDAGPGRGWWRVEGTDIVYEIDQCQFPGMPKIPPARQPIQQLIEDDRQTRSWADHPVAK